MPKGTALLDYFKNSDDPIVSKIWQEKLEPNFDRLPLFHEVQEMILADPYTVAYTESPIKMTQGYISCKIVDIKPPIRKTHLAFATQKNSPYFQAFKHHVNNIKEAGLVQKYIKSHRMEAQVCKDYSGGPVTIKQSYSAFQILAAGMLVAFGCFILESFLLPERVKSFDPDEKKTRKRTYFMRNRKMITKSNSRKQYQISKP